MSSLLLLSRDAPHASFLKTALESHRYEILGELQDAARLHAEVVRLAPELIIVCAHTLDETTIESLESIAASCPRPVIVFARDPSRESIRRAVEAGVAAYVVDGWAPERVRPIIEAACARFDAYSSIRKELASIREKLAERKLIERAKGIVMEQRTLSEEHAYSALRKMAMDQNLTLAEVARRVIAVSRLLA